MWRGTLLLVLVLAVASCAWGQAEIPRDQSSPPPVQAPPRSDPMPAPRGPNDSSSRDSDNLGPPPDVTTDDSVTELRPWDPHKAMKDVEVGSYYFKQDNYRGALSRFCEALEYKPGDAVATFRVAEALEKMGDIGGALGYYGQYLKILPNGPSAAQAKKALERINARAERPDKHLAQKEGCEAPGKVAKSRPEPFDPDRPVLTRKPTSQPSEKSQ
jgi:tetratricopeptide (TPR) repeat protein